GGGRRVAGVQGAAAVLVDEDRHPAQPGVVGGDPVAGLVGVLLAADREGLEVGEGQPGLVGPGGAGDGVPGAADGLDVAVGQDLVDLLAGVGVVQAGPCPALFRSGGGRRVAGVQGAAAVLVDEDRHPAQPGVVGGDPVAGLVGVLGALDA